MVDVLCAELPSLGSRVHSDVSLRAGGSAVNAAAAAVAAGASATVIGRIGADASGDLVLSELAALGIAAELVRDPDLPTGMAVALPGATVVATRGANARFSVEDVPERVDGDALFVSGFALFQPGSADAAAAAIERFTGARVGVDLASPALARVARDVDLVTGAQETVVFATADEAEAMTGSGPEAAAHALGSRFSVACVKLGEEGALAVAGGHLERRRADPIMRRSPFGAGDAFAGVFLVALDAGHSLGSALELACAAGASAAARQQ